MGVFIKANKYRDRNMFDKDEVLIKSLENRYLSLREIYQNDIIFLPENIFGDGVYDIKCPIYMAQNTSLFKKNLSNYLSENSYQIDIFILNRLNGEKIPTIERNSNSSKIIWLGTIIISSTILPVFTNVLSDYISSKLMKNEEKEVNTEIYIKEKERAVRIKYSGDGDSLIKILNEVSGKANE